MSYQVVSLSGGKDSTAMLLMMLERGEQVDEVVMFDFGVEYPEMYEHIDRLERDTGLTFTRLRIDRPFEWYLSEKDITRGKHAGSKGWGWPRMRARWCTKLKTSAIDKHLKGRADLVQCIGIAADEAHRCKDKRYPLVEWGVTEAEALEYCRARGYDWGGLYDHLRRVSCYLCSLGTLDNFRTLRRLHPELWARVGELDRGAFNSFTKDWTWADLDRRFAREDAQARLEL